MFDLDDPDHRLIHWSHVTFKVNGSVDPEFSTLSLLSDKSCALPVSKLDSIFSAALRSVVVPENAP